MFKNKYLSLLPLLYFSSSFTCAEEYLYRTKPGDNLWDITQKHLIDIRYWSKLVQLNKLPDSDELTPGTLVRIPEEWLNKKEAKAELVYSIGQVTVTLPNKAEISVQNNKPYDQTKTIALIEGTVIKTGNDSLATISFVDDSKLLLQEKSELKLENLSSFGDGSLSDMKIMLQNGSISNDVNSDITKDTRYQVITPLATTAVRGTEFRVSVADGHTNTIAEVLRGKINVRSSAHQKTVDVTKGKAAIVDQNGTIVLKNIPKAPDLNNVPDVIERWPINIALPNVSDIAKYRTIIVNTGESTNKPISDYQSTEAKLLSRGTIKNGKYSMIVSAISTEGLVGEEARKEIALNIFPVPPLIVSPQEKEAIASPQIQFKWTKSTDAKLYQLIVAKDPQFKQLVVHEKALSSTKFSLSERLAGGKYFWKIAAIDRNNHAGPFSDPVEFKVFPPSPGLEEAKIQNGQITLRWANAGEGVKYRFQISNDYHFDDIKNGKIISDNFYKIDDLLADIYYFRLQLIDIEGAESHWSRPQSFTIPSRSFKDYILLPLSFLK